MAELRTVDQDGDVLVVHDRDDLIALTDPEIVARLEIRISDVTTDGVWAPFDLDKDRARALIGFLQEQVDRG